ncbi:MAG: hemerythrin family protein [Thioploca sp.]|nr:hemerythrin family protein [Thioploca sp.]
MNIKTIDEQHQHLIKIINKMHEIIIADGSRKKIELIIEKLFEYTNYHFKTEEKLLETYSYPNWQIHRKEHDDLLKQLLKLKVRLIKGNATISLEMFAFLNNWLVNHILTSDKKYSSYLNDKGVF